MIRRSPTVIPMTDIDVQDVRDLVEKQRADAHKRQQVLQSMQRVVEQDGALDEDSVALLISMKAALNKEKEEKERQRRLGMAGPAGKHPDISMSLDF
jgi:hypothetical protein